MPGYVGLVLLGCDLQRKDPGRQKKRSDDLSGDTHGIAPELVHDIPHGVFVLFQ